MAGAPIRYPTLNSTALQIASSVLTGGQRSFRRDADAYIRRLEPPLRVEGDVPDLSETGWVVLANHYHTPTFRAWWIPFALTSTLKADIHWVMADAWTYPDRFRARVVTPATRWLFRRVARVYGFTSMPPMPPRPWEVEARARAVREVLHYVDEAERPLLGMVPEGGDTPDGGLAIPPPGVGRFLDLLMQRGIYCLPSGIYEEDGRLHLRWGSPIEPANRSKGRAMTRDQQVSDRVMRAIAACLPARLRGPYI